jgi:Factor for inversion stimulation Fis, transcriptional activator
MQPPLKYVRGNAVSAVRLPAAEATRETSLQNAASLGSACLATGGLTTASYEATSHSALSECVSRTVRRYLSDIGDTPSQEGLHALVIREVEGPLLREVLAFHGGNQSRAAAVLGINRATLRKKLAAHGLL